MDTQSANWIKEHIQELYPAVGPPYTVKHNKKGNTLMTWELLPYQITLYINAETKIGVWKILDTNSKLVDIRKADMRVKGIWSTIFSRIMSIATRINSQTMYQANIILPDNCKTCLTGQLHVSLKEIGTNPQCFQCGRYDYSIQVGLNGLINVEIPQEST